MAKVMQGLPAPPVDIREVGGLFDPSDFMPGTRYVRAREERHLACWVLIQAIQDLTFFNRRDPKPINAHIATEVWDWFFAPDPVENTWLYSFENICEILGIHPSAVRQWARLLVSRRAKPQTRPLAGERLEAAV